ncbi:hypothetical protein [Bradyrhizobium japonicum]|uniref:hypothetical protein n=1 Tax=Bradyrhizobium japonicum TaxID=375 RepID=UPI00200BFCFC|nr:hypothetical protein [Bradyrhizobium japonicum]
MQKPRLAGAFGVCNVFCPGAMRAVALSRLDQDLSEAAAVQIGERSWRKFTERVPIWPSVSAVVLLIAVTMNRKPGGDAGLSLFHRETVRACDASRACQ